MERKIPYPIGGSCRSKSVTLFSLSHAQERPPHEWRIWMIEDGTCPVCSNWLPDTVCRTWCLRARQSWIGKLCIWYKIKCNYRLISVEGLHDASCQSLFNSQTHASVEDHYGVGCHWTWWYYALFCPYNWFCGLYGAVYINIMFTVHFKHLLQVHMCRSKMHIMIIYTPGMIQSPSQDMTTIRFR